ncbi:MAG: DUF3598 family protein [Phormidesmis sp. CAN_BIN36]|nr:DUF3598 family protein [Phormidesmis sp. CAN_BIN36]
MKSQWDCFLQNLGEWQGSFTQLSPQGEILSDTPSRLSLEGLDNNQQVRLTLRRAGQPDLVVEYSTIGGGLRFCENGAFSQGSMQFSPYSQFGAELALLDGDRRLRLVQLFNKESQLEQLTLIREQRVGTSAPEQPLLTVDDLIGEWSGEAMTLYLGGRSPDSYQTSLKLHREGDDRLVQELSVGGERTIASTATIHGSVLSFEQIQMLLLPGGASSTCPVQIKLGQPLFLEVGWLLQPDLRQRLIRRYSDKGEWVSLTLVTERKTSFG